MAGSWDTEVGSLVGKKKAQALIDLVSATFPGEKILFVGSCNMFGVDRLAITNRRIIGMFALMTLPKIEFVHSADEVLSADYRMKSLANGHGGRIEFTLKSGEVAKIKGIPNRDMDRVRLACMSLIHPPPTPSNSQAVEARAATGNSRTEVAQTRHFGTLLSKKAIAELRSSAGVGESPWLVLNPPGATGLLAAFSDRVVIVKTGGFTSFVAGSFGGARVATMYFEDITGIEFNSGILTGVLSVLTASYQGSANRDFWKGTTSSRNADSNDPFTLSNTLPMTKEFFAECSPAVSELRQRVSEAKRRTIIVQAERQAPSMGEELEKLATMFQQGILTEQEFAAAKAKLLG